MGCNNGWWGGSNCCWIIILIIILFCCCGCGTGCFGGKYGLRLLNHCRRAVFYTIDKKKPRGRSRAV
jgi:hypothetical protein